MNNHSTPSVCSNLENMSSKDWNEMVSSFNNGSSCSKGFWETDLDNDKFLKHAAKCQQHYQSLKEAFQTKYFGNSKSSTAFYSQLQNDQE
ncbi:hypothetical protein Bhyg_03283 [Pseudolycoriella hygida]|uniref:Uncharacterized protein n=1 Tax=Pseudolycoriella hygida TaxID=35572 RepID=A0A9Q0NDE4_9DIPT|nr:hypothetical protein Bhyg_03283 [Pseudolycoriella hygida]